MKFLFSLFFILSFQTIFCQNVFQKISFNEALKLSQETGKLVLVQLESFECEMYNYLGEKAFENNALSRKVKETFIPIFVDTKNADRDFINDFYNLSNESFGTLFIDGAKNLIHRFEKTTSLIKEYDAEIELALYKNSEVVRLSIFEDFYKKSKSNDDLELWILARRKLNLDNDSLLNIYTNKLSQDSLNSARILDFIANEAPVGGSSPNLLLRNNIQFNKVWYAMPLKQRVFLNNKTISKSMQIAIIEKNEKYALEVASFARNVYDDNYNEGRNAYNFQALKFYQATQNIEKFMQFSTFYYDDIYMKISVDSISKIDSNRKVLEMKHSIAKDTIINGVNKKMRSFSYKPISQNYTSILNNAAWFVYKNTDNKAYLEKALQWAKRANEYFKNFMALDTEARLLYKLGKRTEAIALMEIAVIQKNERIKSNTKFSNFDEVLKNMKENKSILD